MRQLLKDEVAPTLRARGFKGTFPHFTRAGTTRLDLLTFQFSQFGPSLYIEIASCDPEGLTATDGAILVPKGKVRTYDLGLGRRCRIGPKPWLDFTGISNCQDPSKFASLIRETIEREGEPWWQEPKSPFAT
jgi:hypothetical protein